MHATPLDLLRVIAWAPCASWSGTSAELRAAVPSLPDPRPALDQAAKDGLLVVRRSRKVLTIELTALGHDHFAARSLSSHVLPKPSPHLFGTRI